MRCWPAPAPPVPVGGFLRSCPADFQVDELLGDLPAGDQALWLYVEKERLNTAHVADHIADLSGLPAHEVGFAGRKDRAARCRQWFSVPAHAERPALAIGARHVVSNWGGHIRILEHQRRAAKLRVGDHCGNRFRIRVRAVRGDRQALVERAAGIAADGVPNYFERQRFGKGEANLARARRWLQRRRLPPGRSRGFVVGAARAWVFNHVLAARVLRHDWTTALPGDIGPAPTGPLWGRGRSPVSSTTASIEGEALRGLERWLDRLEHSGSAMARRPLVSRPRQMAWKWAGDDWLVSFELDPGAYATNIMGHCFADLREARCAGWFA